MDAPGYRQVEQFRAERCQDYDPPQVERVLTAAEIEQEVVYAGEDTSLPL